MAKSRKATRYDISFVVADFLFNTHRYLEAVDLYKEAQILLKESEVEYRKDHEIILHLRLGCAYLHINEFKEALTNYQQLLKISKKFEDRVRAIVEPAVYKGISKAYSCTGQHIQAIFYQRKFLEIAKENGDKQEEREAYVAMASAFHHLGRKERSIEFLNEALRISKEIKDKEGEGKILVKLGLVYTNLARYREAISHQQRSLQILKDIGDYRGEAESYIELGGTYLEMGEFEKALDYHFKSLQIMTVLGKLEIVGVCYNNIGTTYHALSQFGEALKYFERTLEIMENVGDKGRQGRAHHSLGICYFPLGQYDKAFEHQEKAVKILQEIGDRFGEGRSSCMLGRMYSEIGQYKESIKFFKRAREISQETGDKKVESNAYCGLGGVYHFLDPQSSKGEKCVKKALEITKETGDKKELASNYISLALIYCYKGRYEQSLENHNRGIEIMKEIGDRCGEATASICLACIYAALGKFSSAVELQHKALNIMREVGEVGRQYLSLYCLGLYSTKDGELKKAQKYLFESITCIERDRELLQDEHKLYLDNRTFTSYSALLSLLVIQGNISEALCTAERGRARALVDLLSKRYGIHERYNSNEICVDEIRNLSIQNKGTIIFMATDHIYENIHLWIMEEEKIQYRLSKFGSGDKGFTDLLNLPRKQLLPDVQATAACEDRSLSAYYRVPSSADEKKGESQHRLVEEEEDETKKEESSLHLLYQKLFAPVADLVQREDIIIVPEGDLFMVPFPALQDVNGKFLSETFRIRLIPSLITLKLIQSSPEDFHCPTGALIVGDPAVHPKTRLQPLPEARKEAQEIADLLGVTAIVGNQATKEAILRKMQGVSLIHFAAHGDTERGEIALATSCSSKRIPSKKEFMLTMEDIAKVGIQAKLVVLSCCHSGRGDIMKSEGVVGISRAFLASGARCVLVSLWQLEDESTKEFMIRFYGHLVRDKLSASEALHQSMKWMRESKKYSVSDWAPFVLIGDDVTLDL